MTTATTTFSTSFSRTPQAGDDLFDLSEDALVDWYTQAYLALGQTWDGTTIDLDVMANDKGGTAKVLWSLDNAEARDLLTAQETSWEKTAAGNWIRIFGGKVEYKLGDGSDDPARARTIDSLGADREVADSFVYAIRLGNGTLSYATVHIGIQGANDAASIEGTAQGEVTEDGPVQSTGGRLIVSDVDAGEAALRPVAAGTAGENGHGSFEVAADGTWSYRLDNASAAVQALPAGGTLTDAITVWSLDGTASQVIAVTIHGTNDTPELTGAAAVLPAGAEDTAYTVTLAQLLQGWTDRDADPLSVTGLTATDGAVARNSDGSYTITPTRDYFGPVTLNYDVTDGAADGTVAASLSYGLAPVEDAAVIGGAVAGRVTEDATPSTATGTLAISDPDGTDQESFAAVTGGSTAMGYGTFSVTSDGTWTYALDNANPAVNALDTGSAPLADSFVVTSADGTPQRIDIAIDGSTDAPRDIFLLASDALAAAVAGGAIPGAGSVIGTLQVTGLSNLGIEPNAKFELAGGTTLKFKDGVGPVATETYTVTLTATGAGGASYSETLRFSFGNPGSNEISGTAADDVLFGLAQRDTLNINPDQSIVGTAGSDILFGGSGNDTLLGGTGVDQLFGGEGADILQGGTGADILSGGRGSDVFVFASAAEGGDAIRDFGLEGDSFRIGASGFGGGLRTAAGGTLASDQFQTVASGVGTPMAGSAEARFIFRTTDTTLWFDQDGSGLASGAVLIADLQDGARNLTSADILVTA